MTTITIGMDLGNYDTKTQETTTPSSYRKYATQNLMVNEWVFFEGNYYTPTTERNNQQQDKTQNDYCIIMTLFALAKETIYQITNEIPGISPTEIQEKINLIKEFRLGIGLPVGYFSSNAIKLKDYHIERLSKPFKFVYTGYEFNIKLATCSVYPQDFTAAAYNNSLQIVRDYEDYYIIGIGGETVDIIPVEDGEPQIQKCTSLTKGTTVMYSEIIRAIQHETGKTMDYTTIEKVLLGKNTAIDDKRKSRIIELEKEYVDKLVDEMAHAGLHFDDYPSVFVGGGALMMKPFIEKNSQMGKMEFIEDVRANAKYYAAFVDEEN